MPSAQSSGMSGNQRLVRVSSLRLDPENPRLPESLRGGSQPDLAVVLEMGFDAYAVAQSIADNGYFLGEPMLAIPSPDEPDVWIVVEGNRRLTALLGLTDKDVRSQFAQPERWEKVAERCVLGADHEVPVIVHQSRSATHAEVARAHVVGKLPWQPFMQARFIAARVAEGKTVSEVADLIGITKSKAADLFRDQAVVAQAQRLGLQTGGIEKAFSVLTVAMGNTKLRDHVGAPLGSRLNPAKDPIPAEKTEELQELISWVFGDEENEPKITDSRQTSLLGNVVASDVGLAALRDGASLEEAKQKVAAAGMDPRDRLLQRLGAARNALLASSDDLSAHASDPQVGAVLSDVEAIVESLRTIITEVSPDSPAA
jgi:hypothetical protein